MATIVTRIGKGSELTFQEGDANFTNLNNDKIENVSEDTNPSLGGNLDLDGFGIKDSTKNTVTLGGIEYQSQSATEITGNVQNVDDVRNPNTVQLDQSFDFNTRIQFSGQDADSAGLTAGTDYYLVADVGNNEFEISDQDNGSPISLTDPGVYGDFSYTAFQGNEIEPNSVLVYNGSEVQIQNSIQGITIANFQYAVEDLGTNDNPASNELESSATKVKLLQINSSLNLPDFAFENGEFVILYVTGNGSVTSSASAIFRDGNNQINGNAKVEAFYDGQTYWISVDNYS